MKTRISSRIRKILSIIAFLTIGYLTIILFNLSHHRETLPWLASFLLTTLWIILLGFIWPNILEENEPSSRSIKAQRITGLIGLIGGLSSCIAFIAFGYHMCQQFYIHHYNTASIAEIMNGLPKIVTKTTILLSIGLVSGSIGFLALLMGRKNTYRWLGVIGGILPIVFLISLWFMPDKLIPHLGPITENELHRFRFSGDIYMFRHMYTGIEISLDDDWLQKTFNRIPYHPEKYKPGLSRMEQDEAIKDVFTWWIANKNYLFWKNNKFIVDEEAKVAGVWTDEYRTTHPWGKDEGTNKTSQQNSPQETQK